MFVWEAIYFVLMIWFLLFRHFFWYCGAHYGVSFREAHVDWSGVVKFKGSSSWLCNVLQATRHEETDPKPVIQSKAACFCHHHEQPLPTRHPDAKRSDCRDGSLPLTLSGRGREGFGHERLGHSIYRLWTGSRPHALTTHVTSGRRDVQLRYLIGRSEMTSSRDCIIAIHSCQFSGNCTVTCIGVYKIVQICQVETGHCRSRPAARDHMLKHATRFAQGKQVLKWILGGKAGALL